MLKTYQRNTNIGVGIGWILMTVGTYMKGDHTPTSAIAGPVLLLVGIVVFVWGCVQYAKAKGHSGYWGAFGLLWILGLLVLFFLPDRHKKTTPPPGEGT